MVAGNWMPRYQAALQWANMQDDLCQEVWGELNCQKGDPACKGGPASAVFDCDSDEVAHKATSAAREGMQWDYLNSTFCLVPTDGRLASNRLFQTLASGCVPVVLGDPERGDLEAWVRGLAHWSPRWCVLALLAVAEQLLASAPKGMRSLSAAEVRGYVKRKLGDAKKRDKRLASRAWAPQHV